MAAEGEGKGEDGGEHDAQEAEGRGDSGEEALGDRGEGPEDCGAACTQGETGEGKEGASKEELGST